MHTHVSASLRNLKTCPSLCCMAAQLNISQHLWRWYINWVCTSRAVVLESDLKTFFYRLGLVLDSLVFGLGLVSDLVIGLAKCSSWSRPSPAIYAFFFLFQNKDSLVPQMGNVMAIGLTPSRTGIVIGHLLNAQLHHMSVRLALLAAWRHKLSLFWPQTRCRQVALYSLVLQSSLEFSLSLSFAFKYLINAHAHFAFTFISGQLLIYNLQRHIFCNKHGTLINKTNKNTPLHAISLI